jgi:hypothetical protein
MQNRERDCFFGKLTESGYDQGQTVTASERPKMEDNVKKNRIPMDSAIG